MAIARSHQMAIRVAHKASRALIARRARQVWLMQMSCFAAFMMGVMQFFITAYSLLPLPRRELVERRRQAWRAFIRPIIEDGSFRLRYRMTYSDFKELYRTLRSRLELDELRGRGRNGTIAGEWALAGTLRWLAGGSIYEVMDGPHMARSTAYAKIASTLEAILDCKRLRVKFPRTPDALRQAAAGFKGRSSQDLIKCCVSAADGLLIRRRKPTRREHAAPERFYSGHKKTVGMNMQAMCTADYVIVACCCNTPGSTNDRQAWTLAKFDKLIESLPEPYYVVGDAAYGPTEKMLVPYPGTELEHSMDTFNYYQSQVRISIEQTFGIMVRTWGILWKPLEVPLDSTAAVVHTIVRLHNFLRRRRSDHGWPTQGLVLEENCPALDENGMLLNEKFATANPGRTPATQSQLRENIRQEVEAQTLVRPYHNVQRNRQWRNSQEVEDFYDEEEE